MGAPNSPIQPTYGGSIGVGVRLSESMTSWPAPPDRIRSAARTCFARVPGLNPDSRLVGLLLRDVVLTRDGNCPAGALRRSPGPGSSPAGDLLPSSLRPNRPVSNRRAYPYRNLVGSHPQERLVVAGAPADQRAAASSCRRSPRGNRCPRHARGRNRHAPAPRLPRSAPPPRSPAAGRPASGRSLPRPAPPAGGR